MVTFVIVQHLLASGREIDTKMRSTLNSKTAAEQGRAMGTRATTAGNETEEDFQRKKTTGPLCANLIDEYERDPDGTRFMLRKELGLIGGFAESLRQKAETITRT